MNDVLRVVCVCSHNRTRSVLAAALLQVHLHGHGVDAMVSSAGFASDGEPATHETVRRLAARGIDVSGHRSRRIDATTFTRVDVVATAQHDHVVEIAGGEPDLFGRTFTLPELVARGEGVGPRGTRTVDEWLAEVGATRPGAFEYLDAGDLGLIAEVADPTGHSRRHWDAAVAEIDDLTARLARLLAS